MTRGLPQIECYGQYSGGNYGLHCMRVVVGPVSVWYSYSTPVAFKVGCQARVVHENAWGPTTGRHLNAIDGGDKHAKAARVSGEEFERLWSEQITSALNPGASQVL